MKSNKKAFTLIELIIVVVILGILASIAVVGYNAIINQSKDQAVTSAADSVVSGLQGLAAFDAGTGFENWGDYMTDLAAADLPAGVEVMASLDDAAAGVSLAGTVLAAGETVDNEIESVRLEQNEYAACIVFTGVEADANIAEGTDYTVTVGAVTAGGGIAADQTCTL